MTTTLERQREEADRRERILAHPEWTLLRIGWEVEPGRIQGSVFYRMGDGLGPATGGSSTRDVLAREVMWGLQDRGQQWGIQVLAMPPEPLLPLYCADCNEVHMMRWLDVERVVYTLQGEHTDLVVGLRTGGRSLEFEPEGGEPACLLEVIGWSHDGEMFGEHVESLVESREVMQPLDCPRHDQDEGPHHAPLCHYYDPEP